MFNDSTASSNGDAAAVSERLATLIHDEIARAGGWIRFSRFMELALYAPGLGYYSAGATKIGSLPDDGSDFITAPERTPLFARALARPVAQVLEESGDTIVELGGGTGRLAADLLAELEALDRLPASYVLLDVSADLRERQHRTLQRQVPHLLPRVRWADALPERIHGVVVANEVLDALPIDLVVWDGKQWSARGATGDGRRLSYADQTLPAEVADEVRTLALDTSQFAPGYQTEVHLAARALTATLLGRMTPQSVAIFIDYGFPASEYYHPQRSMGTLMTHRQHRTSTDPLIDLGLQDITAHVNFSAIADAAASAGAVPVGYVSQSTFLIDCGIAELLGGAATDTRAWAAQSAAVNMLMSEAEMGELFKVIALARQPWQLTGFRQRDRTHTL
jgi:SAM-dependent MidA family methyltransferase